MTAPDLTIQPDEIHWRVGSTYDKNGTKMGMLLGYIDARDAMAKLDQLDPQWSSKMEAIRVGTAEGVRCTLIVNGVAREDVGVPSDTEGLKGAFSDALKRAAVHFGIGRELYELPKIAVECEVNPATGKVKRPKALPRWDGHKWTIDSALGWVRYDAPPSQPQDGQRNRAVGAPGSGRTRPAAPTLRSVEENALLDEIRDVAIQRGLDSDALSRVSDAVGVPKGEHANADQLRAILARIESPSDGVGTPSTAEGASETARASGAPPTPSSEAATVQAGEIAPPDTQPVPDSTGLLDAVLDVTGGELVDAEPPKRARTVDEAIADAKSKAKKVPA